MLQMPYSKEMEKNLLACLLQSEEARLNLAAEINKNDFYSGNNQKIYQAIYELEDSKQEIDIATVGQRLHEQKAFDNIATYLTDVICSIATTANYETYAKIVKEKSLRRKMIKIADKITGLASNEDLDINQSVSRAEEMLLNLSDTKTNDRGYKHIKDLLMEHMPEIWNREEQNEVIGIETPFSKFNMLTAGLQGSKLYVLAGRPGMGKTTIAENLVQYAALNGHSTGIFSLEMDNTENLDRMLAYDAEVDYQKIIKGTTSRAEKEMLDKSAAKMCECGHILINDTAGLTIQEIRSEARKMKKAYDVELIMVDYLTLIQGGDTERDDLRISDIARNMKNMAKELDIPVILLAQLNRGVEQRQDKRPTKADLKGSSGIEDAADLIALLYREGYYNLDIGNDLRGVTEVIVDKYRQGQTGVFFLDFDYRYYKFNDASQKKIDKYRDQVGI